MLFGGLQQLTLIDYPSKIAATLFTSGCNFRCPFCQNPELVEPVKIKKHPQVSEKTLFNFLKARQGLLDGLCLTGGEPLIQADLIDFLKKIKQMGFLIKLDTNGSQPVKLKKLFQKNLLDFLAMDIKSSPAKYNQAAGQLVDLRDINQSIDLIKKSKIDYEFRTTAAPNLIDKKEIEKIGQWLEGAKSFALQQFQNKKTLDASFQKIKPYSEEKLKELIQIAQPYFEKAELRGL